MAKVAAIVLAAGLSTRMYGGKKLFLPYNNRTIIEEVLFQLLNSRVDEIIVVASELSLSSLQSICSRNDQFRLVNNPNYTMGMTTSIQAGIQNCPDDIQGYMICLGDMPKIKAETYNQILAVFQSALVDNPKTITVPYFEGKKGNPVIFSTFYKQLILDHNDMEGCRNIINDHQNDINMLQLYTDDILFDIDTLTDYERL